MTDSCASGFAPALGTVAGAGPAAVEVVVEEVAVVVGGGGRGREREGRERGGVCSSSTTRFKLVCCPEVPCVSSSPPSLLILFLWSSGEGVRCFPIEFFRGFGTGRFASVVGWEVETGGGWPWEVGGAWEGGRITGVGRRGAGFGHGRRVSDEKGGTEGGRVCIHHLIH